MDFLPPEMQLKIFSYLNGKSLISMASTNKSWRDFILNSPQLMRCVDFKFTDVNRDQFLKKYGGGLACITVGENLRNRYFRGGYRTYAASKSMQLLAADLKQLLESIPNIKEIEFESIGVPCVKNLRSNLSLPRLEKLTLINNANNHRIFCFLNDCRNVKEYTSSIEVIYSQINYFSDPVYWNWLNNQTHLTTLNLCDQSAFEFFKHVNASDLKINLKKVSLKVNYVYNHNRNFALNVGAIIEFLKQQINIEELLTENFSIYDRATQFSDLFDQILFQMPNLKTLSMLETIVHTSNFSKVNDRLEKLTTRIWENENVSKYFGMFPNIKNMKLTACPYNHYTQTPTLKLASNLMELEKLKLYKFDLSNIFLAAKFDKLKKISFYKCKLNSNDWKLITVNMPLIEKLVLHEFFLSNESATHFKNWKRLQLIVFKCGIYQHGLIDILCQNTSLKNLKISLAMFQQFQEELKFADINIEIYKTKNKFNLGVAMLKHQNNNQMYEWIDNETDFVRISTY